MSCVWQQRQVLDLVTEARAVLLHEELIPNKLSVRLVDWTGQQRLDRSNAVGHVRHQFSRL